MGVRPYVDSKSKFFAGYITAARIVAQVDFGMIIGYVLVDGLTVVGGEGTVLLWTLGKGNKTMIGVSLPQYRVFIKNREMFKDLPT